MEWSVVLGAARAGARLALVGVHAEPRDKHAGPDNAPAQRIGRADRRGIVACADVFRDGHVPRDGVAGARTVAVRRERGGKGPVDFFLLHIIKTQWICRMKLREREACR
jgi:hypothetical protein